MIAALLLLAQITLAPEQPKPVPATIAQLHADPKRFDGQVVRVQGYISRCDPLDCSIAEHAQNAPGGTGQSLSVAPDPTFDATLKPLLPTYVEFDARFDARCLSITCTGRAPELTVTQLRGVIDPTAPPPED